MPLSGKHLLRASRRNVGRSIVHRLLPGFSKARQVEPTLGKSLICASMHKAGSSIIDNILTDFCTARGLELDRIALTVPSSSLTEPEIFVNYQEKMKTEGVYYGVARGPYVADMPKLQELRIIVQVRDPRDCITSAYFSFRNSHVAPKDPAKLKAFMERREKLQNLDIDGYAVSQSGSYRTRMRVLRELIEKHDDVLLLTYEEMVLDTENWLARIADFIGQPVTEELRTALGGKIDFTVSAENPGRHKRQVTPGDHKRKLAPETIAALNAEMGSEMAFFGYSD